MFDSKATRGAALGYGLPFTSILPVAEGAITIEAAGQALAAYFYDLDAAAVFVPTTPVPLGLRFSHPQDELGIRAVSVTLATGTLVSAATGVSNLFDGNPARALKITGTALDVVFEFASDVLPEFPALINSNLDVAARLQGHTSNSWGAPDIDLAFAIPVMQADGFFTAPWLDLTDYTAKPWWRLHITGNALPIRIGELWLGSTMRQTDDCYLYDGVDPVSDGQSIIHDTNHGVELAYRQAGRREAYDGSLMVDADDLAKLEALIAAIHYRARPFLCVVRDDQQDAWLVKYMGDRLSRPPLVVDETYQVPFPIRQVSYGLPWVDPDA